MFYIILSIHLTLCVALIGLVLLQQGKGADMGAAFGGGSSNTFFGAAGATAFITKLTTGVAVSFMLTSILLVNIYSSYATAGMNTQGSADPVKALVEGSQAQLPAASAPVAAAPGAAQPAQNNAQNAPAPVENSDKK